MSFEKTTDDQIKFHTDYFGAWFEEQNEADRIDLRNMLRVQRQPALVTFQPGDGTRYQFLLVPTPEEFIISDAGRDPKREEKGSVTLLVTILNNLGDGVGTFRKDDGILGIRCGMADEMKIRNPCTSEALARTIEVLWSDGAE